MTRPKVDPDKRQRTAQACDSCKRRKQKCNGLKPCNTCTKRNLECSYTPNNPDHDPASPPKRRQLEPPQASAPIASVGEIPSLAAWDQVKPSVETKDIKMKEAGPGPTSTAAPDPNHRTSTAPIPRQELDFDRRSRNSTTSGPDEEAAMYTAPRMLQDSTGRLLYVGDSATLSCLQLIRMIVESIAGHSPFTLDPRRHRIMENTVTLPPDIRPQTQLLPDRQTADVLINSFFTNTSAFVEVFDRRYFISSVVDLCYSNPMDAPASSVCILYLTFAIGLVLATPLPGTREETIIKQLRSARYDRAEVFFRSAKCLADPVSGFEDADFWSVQALLLMAVYMLAVSKRNAAYAYYGMAVRSAFALGLHREETMVVFTLVELSIRRNVWRSLFVLDRFLATSLGRPTAISEEDCSEHALKAPEPAGAFADAADLLHMPNSTGLDAAVRSCRVVGDILKRVYSKRKISTKVAQDIADSQKNWPSTLHPSLHWKQAMNAGTNPAHGIAILHVNLLYCHSIILLTRPFFLFLVTKVEKERANGGNPSPRMSSRMEKFSEACVQASYHTIVQVQIAFESNYLPQRNPFVLYFLFSASLIVLSNEFALLYHNASYDTCITNAINILRYCSETDPQADRVLYIVTSFRDEVARRTSAAAAASSAATAATAQASSGATPVPSLGLGLGSTAAQPGSGPAELPGADLARRGDGTYPFLHHMPTISASPGATYDPMSSFFTSHSSHESRHNSLRHSTSIHAAPVAAATHPHLSREGSSSTTVGLSPGHSMAGAPGGVRVGVGVGGTGGGRPGGAVTTAAAANPSQSGPGPLPPPSSSTVGTPITSMHPPPKPDPIPLPHLKAESLPLPHLNASVSAPAGVPPINEASVVVSPAPPPGIATSASTPLGDGPPGGSTGSGDGFGGHEAEFDFDSLWAWPESSHGHGGGHAHNGAGGATAGGMGGGRFGGGVGGDGQHADGHGARGGGGGFAGFIHGGHSGSAGSGVQGQGQGQGQGHGGAHGIVLGGGTGLGANVPLYPTSDFS